MLEKGVILVTPSKQGRKTQDFLLQRLSFPYHILQALKSSLFLQPLSHLILLESQCLRESRLLMDSSIYPKQILRTLIKCLLYISYVSHFECNPCYHIYFRYFHSYYQENPPIGTDFTF